jgi:hypothetical protein
MVVLVVAVGLALAGCSNPCEKLAKAVCTKANDAKICDQAKADAKKSDKKQYPDCEKQLAKVDEVVKGLKASEEAKKLGAKGIETPPPAPPAPPAPPPPPAPVAPTQ